MSSNVELVSKEPIAIVGVGCVLPDAPDVRTFWDNLLAGKSSVKEVPKARWDAELFWSADRSAPDKTYAKIGAFVDDDAFQPLDYRMLPTSVAQIDPSQRWALAATRQALLDAGLKTGLKADEKAGGKEFDRNRCAVILGNAMGGELMKLHTKRLYWPQVEAALRADATFRKLSPQDQEEVLRRTETTYKSDVPPVTEDSMPGTLSNVAAGRIANVFDLAGKNFTTDAACASSLAALDAAVDTLRKDEADLVIWGGTDRSMDITPYVEFSKIGALSADGSRPFDANANGFVMGEGCAVFVLKRLGDAERDGDKVYAVIRGVGGSSDGKGKGITAPNPAGQVKAVVRAYQDAGIDPFTVGYLEAHGTSTPVGDPVELTSVEEAYRSLSKASVAPGSIAVGSVKSNMGHLKSAAGAAGLLKAALALKTGTIPPSINVQTPNPRIDWTRSPFRIAARATQWPRPEGGVRRAAVSSFGFGGTNFHVVLEEHVPGRLKVRPGAGGGLAQGRAASEPAPAAAPMQVDTAAFQAAFARVAPLEAEAVVIDAGSAAQAAGQLAAAQPSFARDGTGPRLRDVLRPHTERGVAAAQRVAFSVAAPEDVPKKLAQAQEAATNPQKARLAFQQGVFLGQGKPKGKVAFLFPGQGTQYVNMLRDLAQKYEVVRNTFDEADQILLSELDGVKLTDILWPTPDTPEAQAASERKLQLTEYTQPAVLAADVAILRLLRQWGIEPDVVAGHSLGEYGALVAAGVLSFGDALHAVAARGREMAHVEVPDLGKMASVSADWTAVQGALTGLTEYVIPANKNCPSQTVIAGSSKGVDQAVAMLQQKGLQVQFLPVSAAFHSAIVAPASKPLRNVLARLDVKSPKVRVLSNVGAQPYQDDPEWIRDNLATQVANPVEWIDIIERMHAEGVRTFIEVGPKLALTNFVRDILKAHPDVVAIGANHPKKGGIVHINELYAFLGAWGFHPRVPEPGDAAVFTPQFRDPAGPFRRAVAAPPSPSPGSAAPAAGDALSALERIQRDVEALKAQLRAAPPTLAAPAPATSPMVAAGTTDGALAARMKAFGICLDDIGVSGISVGLPGTSHDLFSDDNFDRILRGENLIDTIPPEERRKLTDKNISRLVKGADGSAHFQAIHDIQQVIQLAGRRGGFDLRTWGVDKELIESLDRTFQYAIAAGLEALRDAGIPLQRTYLETSQGTFLPKEWKLPEGLRDETGIIFASAFPGYDNLLRDVSRYLSDKYAGRTRDELQQLYADLIGVVQDPGQRERLQAAFDREFERLQDVLPTEGQARYEFNRKFLFNVLSMGHSQLAQLIGARGPNTQVNAACASSTQAIAIAEDWIRTGRARRVLVVGADDVTSDAMFEWIGSGFLASGAATTQGDVTKAALPFDKRRHGMIIGMGAVGLVVEATPETERRGMRPVARLLATKVSNSAFHGSRLDVSHIAGEMRDLLATAGRRYGITPDGIADKAVFMSHETYTPARGGSASAEIHALRATFGAKANQVVVANTKGFTGHPQGAGIEDAIVLKCLQRGRLPPIANFREPDPELGDLRLSQGGEYPNVRYALRLAAGFGSQVAMTLMELAARESERVADPARHTAWLSEVSGLPSARVEVQNRTLRIVDQGPPARKPKPAPVTAQIVAAPAAPAQPRTPVDIAPVAGPSNPASASGGAASQDDVLKRLLALVQEKTGYPPELLDPELDMEADLGIDTVKQAEIFGLIREAYSLPQEQSIQIKDYNTLRKVAGYVATRLTPGAQPTSAVAAASPVSAAAPATLTPTTPAAPATHSTSTQPTSSQGLPLPPSTSLATPAGDVLERLLAMVAEKTGYPRELLDPDLDMEADLGIDTVKQAELFGMIREAYSLPPEEGIQIKDYPTLRKVAGYVQARIGASPTETATTPTAATPAAPLPPAPAASSATPASPAADSPPPATASAGNGLDPAAVLAKVTELVAAKTGYPADMLQPDLDMEADLGIDTVKQAELFGEVRGAFGIAPVEGLQLKDYPTLRKVAGFVLAQGTSPGATGVASGAPATRSPPAPSATPSAAQSQPTVAHAPASTGASPSIVRRAPVPRAQASPNQANALQHGPVLVLGDADDALTAALQKAGFQPGRGVAAPVGILCVAAQPGQPAAERAGALFDALKEHRARLGSGSFVCVVTRQDGAHGLSAPRDATMAALAGLAKAARKELPGCVVKAIDLHPDASDAGALVMEELLRGGTRTEVAFDAAGRRHVVDVAPAALPSATPSLAGKGLVVSGGAQGITVEMLAAIAPQGVRLLILGRTDQPEDAGVWAAWTDADWKAEEARTVAALKAKGEKATPVAVQKAVEPKRKAADVHRNLARLQQLGAQVLYAPVDVTNAADVAEAVAWARGIWGRIDGVLHAAGVEVSKDLASKDRRQFDMVFGVKAAGWDALMKATAGDRLELLASFGSIAGRFGNIGQVDYSAANEYLAKAVRVEAARRGVPTAFTVAWGPWGEVGMATKGSILQIMHASGVTPIPTREGVAQFLAELAAPGSRESVVAGEVGAIDIDAQVVPAAGAPRPASDAAPAAPAARDESAAAAQAIAADPSRFRLLERVVAFVPGDRVVARLHVDQARDPYLRDHRVDGIPYLPGVFGVEAFAEAASLLAPGQVLLAADGVRFASPLKQLKPAPVDAEAECRVLQVGHGQTQVACRLTTRFVGPDGKAHGEPRLHFEATLRFGPAPATVGSAAPACDAAVQRGAIYPPFFHGPSFQVLENAGPLGDTAVATFRDPPEAHFAAGPARFASMPMVGEALFQACGLRTLAMDRAMSLPAGIESAEYLHHGPLPRKVTLVARYTGRTPDGLRRFDAEAIGDGHVLLRLKGYTMVETGPADAGSLLPATASAPERRAAGGERPTTPAAPGSGTATAVAAAAAASVPGKPANGAANGHAHADAIQGASVLLPQSDEVHYAAVAVESVPATDQHFTERELATYAKFPVPKRKDEWRAGRLAAKKAVLETNPALAPRDVEVIPDEKSGRPRLLLRGKESALWVSISHRDGLAVAAVSPAPVGVDLETFEDRTRAFLEEAFHVSELRGLLEAADPKFDAACMWAAKEAALKRAGVGLRSDVRAHRVSADQSGGAVVEGPTGRFGIRFFDLGGKVLAVSAPHLDPDLKAQAGMR